jgi:hypothetical protein
MAELFFILFAISCKKDRSDQGPSTGTTAPTNFATLGLYEQVTSTDRRIYIAVSKIGTQAVVCDPVFDTGSTGLVIDATGTVPASMITSTGFQVPNGDSVNVNGITITTQQAVISYGGVGDEIQVYGNLAYAPIALGDGNGNIVTTPRIPIFLYYKVMDVTNNKQLAAHSADVFGVGPGVSYTSRSIASPLSYFKLPANITSGFRLGVLNNSLFSSAGTYVSGLLYIGLTPNDLSASNFIMHPLTYNAISGYSPNLTSTITYGTQTIPGTVLFDTGTPATSIIESSTASSNVANLPTNTTVSMTTAQGFTYSYTTTSTYNLTTVENTSYSHDIRTIFSIDFFLNNEYLLDYTNHQIGLKNN